METEIQKCSNFGGLYEGTVYHDTYTGNVDMRKNADFKKALTTTLSTYAAGTLPSLIPVYVDPEIIDLTRRATPLVELIPRVTNYGKYVDYNQITALGGSFAAFEDAAVAEVNDTYVRRHLSIKYIYSVGRVTGPMFAASKQYLSSGGYVDALSLEVKNKTIALKRYEEDMIINGDSIASRTTQDGAGSTTVIGTEFDGFFNFITNNNSCGLGGSASYSTDMAGANFTIDTLRTAIRTCRTAGGEPNLGVTDYASYDRLKALIQDELRYVSTQTIAWGITTVSFEGLPLIASRFVSTTNGTGAMTTNGRCFYILDTNNIEMRVLQDVTYEELAQTNDSKKFMLKLYEALVLKAPQFNHVVFDIGVA
jgi:hypothetical protein